MHRPLCMDPWWLFSAQPSPSRWAWACLCHTPKFLFWVIHRKH
jgi:UDP-N-acetyl-D-mannosaminuronic acid transferase (WecB/TagA/CpsF family)